MNEILMEDKETFVKELKLEDFKIYDDNSDVFIMILKTKPELCDIDILGKSSYEWVRNVVKDYNFKEYDYNNEDIVRFIKENVFNKKIVVVLFSNLPLLTKSTLESYIEYFKIKRLSTLKMPKGFIFDFQYLLNVEKVYNPQTINLFEEDFIALNSLNDLSRIFNTMKKRILDFHSSNGVIIYDENSTIIDAEVNINAGVKIYPNNTILGETYLSNGVVFCGGNKINNSIIKDNCLIENSIIDNCIIESNCKVTDYSVIKNKVVISENSTICNKTILGEK